MSPGPSVMLLDAALRQALVATRSLGRAGSRVVLAESTDDLPAPSFSSRWCSSTVELPSRRSTSFLPGLDAALAAAPVDVVVPCHDGTVDLLRSARNALERRIALALAPEPALATMVDKRRTLALAAQVGVRVPRGVVVDRGDDLSEVETHVGLPAVVKPARSWVEGAAPQRLLCALVTTSAGLREELARVWAAGGDALVQEWVPGRREAVSILLDPRGRVVAAFAQVAQRMHPVLGGSSVLREAVALPHDALEASLRLLEACGATGYAEVEFRRDRNDRPVLMEVNPRLSASVEVAVRAGVDFPRLLALCALGGDVPHVPTYRVGVRMRWLGGDVRWLRDTLRHPGLPDHLPRTTAIGAFSSSFLTPSHYDYVDGFDLRPVAAAVAGFARQAARRAASARSAPASATLNGERA